MPNLVIQLLAIAVAIAGTWMLQAAWRSAQRSWPKILAGWGLVLASLCIWTYTSAVDKGVALGITAWVVVATLFLCAAAMKSPIRQARPVKKKEATVAVTGAHQITKREIFRHALTVLIIGPLAGLSAMAVSTLLLIVMQALKVEYTAGLATASIVFPLLWGGLAVALAYQRKLLTRLITIFSVGIGSLGFLLIVS